MNKEWPIWSSIINYIKTDLWWNEKTDDTLRPSEPPQTHNEQANACIISQSPTSNSQFGKNYKRSFQKNIQRAQKTLEVFLLNLKVMPNKS